MSITLPCPRCEYTIRAADSAAGTTILCPSCRGRVAVPAVEKPKPAPTARPAPAATGGDWDGDEPPAKKGKRRSNTALLVGGGLAVVAIVGGFAAAAMFAARDRAREREFAERAMREQEFAEFARQRANFGFGGPGGDDAATVADLDQMAAQWPAIPQDANRAARLRAARLEWAHKTTDRAFDRSAGAKQPWAPAARAALALRAKELAVHPEFALPVVTPDPTGKALSDAVAAGCDDPLVLYFHLRAFFGDSLGAAPIKDARRVGRLMGESDYPDVWKAYVARDLGLALSAAKAPATEVAACDRQFWEAFGRAAADPDPVTQDHVLALARLREGLTLFRGVAREKAYEELAAALQKAGAPEYTRQVARGRFLTNHAWDARGGGFADTVTVEGARLLEERLTAAERALTTAYELDPDRPHAPTHMLTVCKGRNRPRPEMEPWFERALRADPDNFQACNAKLEYLQPKWHGTPEEHIAFAWQCARTGNTVGMLPYAAVANIGGNAPLPPRFPPGVLEQIEQHYADARVWQVLHTALAALRSERPELKWLSGEYVRYALVSGRPDAAERVLDEIGDNPRDAGFLFPDDLAYYREWAKTGRPPAR